MLKKILVFCDASVSSKDEYAIGAFLIINKEQLDGFKTLNQEEIKDYIVTKIKYIKIDTHKSTLAELETFIYVISKIHSLSNKEITIYTDCQTLSDLHGERKDKLVARNFRKKDGSPLKHGDLYRNIIHIFNKYKLNITKIKGHKPKHKKNNVYDIIFSIVDRLSRKKLRSRSFVEAPFYKK